VPGLRSFDGMGLSREELPYKWQASLSAGWLTCRLSAEVNGEISLSVC